MGDKMIFHRPAVGPLSGSMFPIISRQFWLQPVTDEADGSKTNERNGSLRERKIFTILLSDVRNHLNL